MQRVLVFLSVPTLIFFLEQERSLVEKIEGQNDVDRIQGYE